jgi:hypothetical protein
MDLGFIPNIPPPSSESSRIHPPIHEPVQNLASVTKTDLWYNLPQNTTAEWQDQVQWLSILNAANDVLVEVTERTPNAVFRPLHYWHVLYLWTGSARYWAGTSRDAMGKRRHCVSDGSVVDLRVPWMNRRRKTWVSTKVWKLRPLLKRCHKFAETGFQLLSWSREAGLRTERHCPLYERECLLSLIMTAVRDNWTEMRYEAAPGTRVVPSCGDTDTEELCYTVNG